MLFKPRRMPEEGIVFRDWHAGMTFADMAIKYDAHAETVRRYVAVRQEDWKRQLRHPLVSDNRRIVRARVSLPRISIHVAALRDAGINV
ncbi:hypothetical protein [Rhizobium sp. 9140]|uniref:hypothetical protein n=1 Tax=Rhizobium sp. 9140 TaxID=1761900 RepID=UPI000796C855|nr:hypothetical protein [Rhizobium sp. 9140]CZT36165.1 hypothetical protein GA0004734_00031670 [Rhizobium sp. 9140]